MLLDNAVVYALSGDEHADEAARQALVKLAAWPTYVHRHILDQGQFNLRGPLLGSPIVGTDYESWVWRLAVC